MLGATAVCNIVCLDLPKIGERSNQLGGGLKDLSKIEGVRRDRLGNQEAYTPVACCAEGESYHDLQSPEDTIRRPSII